MVKIRWDLEDQPAFSLHYRESRTVRARPNNAAPLVSPLQNGMPRPAAPRPQLITVARVLSVRGQLPRPPRLEMFVLDPSGSTISILSVIFNISWG